MTIQELNMTADTPEKQKLLDHLVKNATEELAAKIKEGGKTLDGAWKFILSYAKSKIDPKKRNGSVGVYVPPEEVFGMMMHYFEDEKEGAEYRTEAEKQDEMERERKRLEAMTPEQIEAERIERERLEQARKEKLAQEEEKRRKREEAKAEKRAKEESRRKAEEAQMTLF